MTAVHASPSSYPDYSDIDYAIDAVLTTLRWATGAPLRQCGQATFAAVNLVFGADNGGAWTSDEIAERVACATIALTADECLPEPFDGLHEGCGHGC